MNTIDRINQLTRERLELYRKASNGLQGDPEVLRRIAEINGELERLWAQRRREQAGAPPQGIDRIIDAAYRRAYGPTYEDAFGPQPVASAEDELKIAA